MTENTLELNESALPIAKTVVGIPFNSETARLGAKIAWEKRRQREEERRKRIEEDRLREEEKAREAMEDGKRYLHSTLMRVRRQMEKFQDMMMEEEDPQKLDRLASAFAKLAEQERILDNRPLPGSHRPKAPKPDKSSSPTLGDEFAPA